MKKDQSKVMSQYRESGFAEGESDGRMEGQRDRQTELNSKDLVANLRSN